MATIEKVRSTLRQTLTLNRWERRRELVFPPGTNLPTHVAVILDGNGTWAEKQGKPRVWGHYQGTQNLKRIIEQCQDWNIPIISAWGFSTENWGRDKKEIAVIHSTAASFLRKNLSRLRERGVKINWAGNRDDVRIPNYFKELLEKAEQETKNNSKHIFNILWNFGEEDARLRAQAKAAKAGYSLEKNKNWWGVASSIWGPYGDFAGQPQFDLVIRTSQQRLSGFPAGYAEIRFLPDVYFPELTAEHLFDIIVNSYSPTKRKFGR